MQLTDIFPSKYVKAADLQGREITVVIADARVEKLGDDRKLVIYFQGKEKGLVCNKTNADRIAYLHGDDTDDWIGKEVTMFTDMVQFNGKTTEAIRIKAAPKRNGGTMTGARPQPADVKPPTGNGPAGPAPRRSEDMDDAIPFAPEWR